MKAPEAASWWSDTDPGGVVDAVVAVEAVPAAFTVVAVEDEDAGAPVVADVDDDDVSAAADDVVDPPAAWPPPVFTPAVFPSCEQAAGTASASTTPSTVRIRRVIDGHHRPRARRS
jgi:hypothetical protein